ncbi:hypothetical protein JZ751_025598, partial [Albula glossodonta]
MAPVAAGLEPVSASTSSSSSSTMKSSRPAPTAAPRPIPPPRRRRYDDEQDPTCAAATLRLLKQRLPSVPAASATGSGVLYVQCYRLSTSQTAGGATEPKDEDRPQNQEKVNAPIIPFGVDLYYWGQDQPTAGKII